MKLENGGLALTQARWSLVGTHLDGVLLELDGHGTVVSRRQPEWDLENRHGEPDPATLTAEP